MPRPRSEKSHVKVLESAVRLFSEQGIDATSMDAIAAHSGVSKATIYKHWPDKETLAEEVLVWLYNLNEEPPPIEHTTLRDDLIAALSYRPAERLMNERERIIPHLMAYSARNPVFGKAWRSRILSRNSVLIKQVLSAAMERGDIDANLPMDMALALLFGPMMYRQIFVAGSRHEKAPPGFIAQVVDVFCKFYGRDMAEIAALKRHSSVKSNRAVVS
jgi:AcrR family transcriptional regulator